MQHDLFSKGSVNDRDSLVTLLSTWKDNIVYANDQYIEFGNRIAYFSDFSFSKKVKTPDRPVDAFFSHVTLPVGMIKGQEIDESNYQLGMFGDIHAHIKVGKSYSIGTPVQVGRTETQTHTIGVWDTESNEFTRIPIYGLPKILPINDRDKVGPDESTNIYYYFKDDSVKVNVENREIKLDTELDVKEMIGQVISEMEVTDLHSEVLKESKYLPIDFNFRPIELSVRNVRSCESFDYSFKTGITYINGPVGSGKSTIINCMLDTMVGINLKDRITFGKEWAQMSLTLEYGGHTYKIVRNSHEMDKFIVDGIESKGNANRDIDNEIKETLPFIQYADSFFFGAWQREILGALKPKRRIELLSKYYQLDLTDEYFNIGSIFRDKIKDNLKVIKSDLSQVILQIKLEEDNQVKIENDLNQSLGKVENLNVGVTELEGLLNNYQKNQRLKSDIQTLKIQRDGLEKNMYDLVQNSLDYERVKGELSILESKITEMDQIKADYDRYYQEKSKLEWQIQVNRESSSAKICPTCKRPLDQEHQEDHTQKIKDLEDRLRGLPIPDINLYNQWNRLLTEKRVEVKGLESTTRKLNEVKSNIQKIDDTLSKIQVEDINIDPVQVANWISDLKIVNHLRETLNRSLDKVKSLTVEKIRLEDLQAKLSLDLTRWNDYLNLLGFDGVIVTKILEKLTDRMSNETFKFKTLSYKKNGKAFADLSVMFNNSGHWITYEDCSTGQRCLCDTYFISKLITYSGMVMFDEFFANVDDSTLDPLFEIIRSIHSNYILICSHSNNVIDIDNKISVTLDEKGHSIYTFN